MITRDTPSIDGVTAALARVGYVLDPAERQYQIGGERALISTGKLVLFGSSVADNRRVVVKVPLNAEGLADIEYERHCREALRRLNVVAGTSRLLFAEEVAFYRDDPLSALVIEFIEQPVKFVRLPLAERVRLALEAFRSLETATLHGRVAQPGVPLAALKRVTSRTYRLETLDYVRRALSAFSDNAELREKTDEIDAFVASHFADEESWPVSLAHTDFNPNNFRVRNGLLYFIDMSGFALASKFDGWARLLNWLAVWDQDLEEALSAHIARSFPEPDLDRLEAMRAVKSAFLVQMYARHLALIRDNPTLWTLQHGRLKFWTAALIATVQGRRISRAECSAFSVFQESLRSEREKQRQESM